VQATPNLKAFRALQKSMLNLVIGIVIAWILGAFLEEWIFRGMALRLVEGSLSASIQTPFATAAAILVAALGATAFHYYQGTRAMLIIGQLSILFGILYVLADRNLWTNVLCHGFYDTIAFIRFAYKASKYSQFEEIEPATTPTEI
jgi:membrane protease YdiL (CAAX protease family)